MHRRCKQIILDFRKTNPNDVDELKTQLNILDNNYAVDVSKVPNALLQGTLSVIFSLLDVPQTNRGYFWSAEDNDDKGIMDLLGDCFDGEVEEVQARLNGSGSGTCKQEGYNGRDDNEIDLDDNAIDLEEEEEEENLSFGPSLPPPPVFETTSSSTPMKNEMNGNPSVGPMIPKEILEMMEKGIPVQIEEFGKPGQDQDKPLNSHNHTRGGKDDDNDDDDDVIGPSLPGQERRIPTDDAYHQIDRVEEERRQKDQPKRLVSVVECEYNKCIFRSLYHSIL